MNKRIPILLGLLLMSIAIWSLITPSYLVNIFIERLEHLGYDLQLRTRVLTEHRKPNDAIAIIDIDDKSIQAEGRWPWSRLKMAELIKQLQSQGAAVIAFDIFFSEQEKNIANLVQEELNKQNLSTPQFEHFLMKHANYFEQDNKFAQQLANNQSVLAISFLPHEHKQNILPAPISILSPKQQQELDLVLAKGYISNIPILQKATKANGFINIFPDSDGIIRRAPLLMQYEKGIYPSLALQAIVLFLGEEIKLVTKLYHDEKKIEGVQIGNRIIPTDAKAQVIIPFIGKSYAFPYYSATDVLNGNLPKDALLGKVLFLGTSATGLGDLQTTAIESPFPGVEIQATLANGLLENNFSYIPEWTFGANIFLVFVFGMIGSFLFPYLGPRILGAIVLLFPCFLLFINNLIWIHTGLILSVILPILLTLLIAIVNIIYGYLFETRRREHLKEMFGQYVPAKHIDEMLKTSSNFALRGEDREMSVLFADIRNFTNISEGMEASALVEMLNTYFTPMTEIIFNHNGTIDKYVGDLLMAFWGAPLHDPDHAKHAIESALKMQQTVTHFGELLAHQKIKKEWPKIKIGIGINSGMMSVGDMGSRYRRNYTVLGDTVNLASRVESLSKFYGVDIIVTEYTIQNQTQFIFRKLDRVKVKGKKNSVEIFEVIGLQKNMSSELNKELNDYNQALNLYFNQEWSKAEIILTELLQNHPENKLYKIYLERIQEFKLNSPGKDWDGVYIHLSK